MDEITNKRQLRRLVVLPYDLVVKEAFPENVQAITNFAKKTGDYPSLSATDIKVMALTYQLEKEKVGTGHLRTEPVIQKAIVTAKKMTGNMNADITGFYKPNKSKTPGGKQSIAMVVENKESVMDIDRKQFTDKAGITIDDDSESDEIDEEQLALQLKNLAVESTDNQECVDSVLVVAKDDTDICEIEDGDQDDDNNGWITPSNIHIAKRQFHSDLMETKHVTVACMTTDFAMQNVLKQMNLNVAALDGRLIKQLRTFILRCYTCFKTTSIMDKKFCPKCGNNTLKKVAVSLDKNGKLKIHINRRHPLTARGKKFSLPKIRGGKHPNNPILVADQPMPDNKPTRLARTKNNPMDDDYIAG